MFGRMRLNHLVLEVRDLKRWQAFAGDFLGLPEPLANPDGSIGYRTDALAQRLILRDGRADDIVALGWEADDDEVVATIAERARAAGGLPTWASAQEAAARRVARMLRFTDPNGLVNEVVTLPERNPAPFRSALVPGGFRTGALGFGHAVLVARNLAEMEAFYRAVFELKISQRLDVRLGPIGAKGTFLYGNPRHHSLALFDMPVRKRLQHFMLEANELADVGMAWERAKRLGIPITLDLGQHPAPDGTISFYGRTPSGSEFEIGYGSGLYEAEDAMPETFNVTSAWGHQPSLAAKLRMASVFVGERLGL